MEPPDFSLNLDQAISEGYVELVDIAGRGGWRGMDITLKNLTSDTSLHLSIPQGTVFHDTSKRYQQMMMTEATHIHVPAQQCMSVALDDAVCVQPDQPPPPARDDRLRIIVKSIAEMSDDEYSKAVGFYKRLGHITPSTASLPRKEGQQQLIKACILHQSKPRQGYLYSIAFPSSLSANVQAANFLAAATNIYNFEKHSDEENFEEDLYEEIDESKLREIKELIKMATHVAPQEEQRYYNSVATYLDDFGDIVEDTLGEILGLAYGSETDRNEARHIMAHVYSQSVGQYYEYMDYEAVIDYLIKAENCAPINEVQHYAKMLEFVEEFDGGLNCNGSVAKVLAMPSDAPLEQKLIDLVVDEALEARNANFDVWTQNAEVKLVSILEILRIRILGANKQKASSVILKGNMEAAGLRQPASTAAHHIVAASDIRAVEARGILRMYGVYINDSHNGVYLPFKSDGLSKNLMNSAYHPGIHTNKYYYELNSRLRNATSRSDVMEILEDIRAELLDNTFPH